MRRQSDFNSAMQRTEESYHKMVEEVEDYAILMLDAEGHILNWNRGAEKIKGYKEQEIIGRHFSCFYPAEDQAAGLPEQLLNRARKEGKAVHEGWRVRKDGTRFWGSIVITALHDKSGQVIGFSKVTRDLTQQKIVAEKLAAYTLELEVQNSELEQFAYVASHDLQEPLRKIRTFAELIKENYGNQAIVNKYFAKLDLSAQRMAELIKSLLNYSRLSKSSDKPEDSILIDLKEVIADVKQDFELLIEEKKASIICGTLPSVRGNHIQLGQLFSNLV